MLLRGDGNKRFDGYTDKGWNATILDNAVNDVVRADKTAIQIRNEYINDPNIYKNGFKSCVEFKIPFGYEIIIKKLQNKLIKLLYEKGICIDTNPTSNLRVGRLDRYDYHPIFRFSKVSSLISRNLKVTVNTDDKGIFETSLERELALLAISLKKQKIRGEYNKWSDSSVYKYVGRLANAGALYRFKN